MELSTARKWLLIFAFCTLMGLLSASTFYTEERIDDELVPYKHFLVDELSAAYAFFLLLPGVLWMLRRFPFTFHTWYRVLPLHLLASLVVGVSHTLLMTLSRTWLYQVFDRGTYIMGNPFFRFVMEYQKQFLLYAGIAVAFHLLDAYRQKQEAEKKSKQLELRQAQLQSSLAETQLTALRGQIQPHFLFNTLNMISSVMYEDVAAADQMISRLSRLLRISLDRAGDQKVRLDEELEFVEAYLEIMKARFHDQIRFTVTRDEALLEALVPSFVVQPLVENAVKHGGTRQGQTLDVSIRAWSKDGRLHINVEDNGRGGAEQPKRESADGIGLQNVGERLQHLYGPSGQVEFGPNSGAGFSVGLSFPLEFAPKVQGAVP